MKNYMTEQIRNIVLMGHSGAGKTTLTEAMLQVAGITKRRGKIEEGNTVSDYDPEEIRRHASINTSILPLEWEEAKLNILDTPGYFDFVGEVKQAVQVADGALIVVSGKSGVEVGTEKAWEYAEEMNLSKMIFVNGMDEETANMGKVLEQLKNKFGKSIAPFQVPIRENEKFVGFVNVVKMEGRRYVDGKVITCDVPEHMSDEVAVVRNMILEAVAETDEELLEKYFNEEPFTLEEIQDALRKGILDGSIVPVLCGSAIYNKGIQVLLHSLVKYMPSLKDHQPTMVVEDITTHEPHQIRCDSSEPLTAFVFKTIVDPYVGRLSLFKVYSGVFKADSNVYNANKDCMERVSQIYMLRGKEQIPVSQLQAGDIGAIAKLQETGTGDTLCVKNRAVLFPAIVFPESLMTMAIMPKKGDEDKLSTGLQRLLEEDLTMRILIDPDTKESLLSGIGEQHLDVIVNKLKAKFKLEVELMPPKVPYRETIKKKVKVQGKHKKQSGGHGQYGDVHMEFEPSGDLEKPYVFEEKIFGGAVPKQYFPAVEKGIQESVRSGILAGYPVVGLKATLVDGSYHPVDSSEMAFKIATSLAFKEGMKKANPVILEPIAAVTVMIPDEYLGDIIGDLNKRRGRILGMHPKNNGQEVVAEVPLAEMFKYATDLRSMTQGRGSYTLKFERYEKVPSDIQLKVIEAKKQEVS
ncbi:MAG: elongation factor G [Epulopiscium sp.]|nr:elongation factor G [Candidatus Epulonipiscium sp.]